MRVRVSWVPESIDTALLTCLAFALTEAALVGIEAPQPVISRGGRFGILLRESVDNIRVDLYFSS